MVRKAKLRDSEEVAQMFVEFMRNHDKIVLKENPKLKPYVAKKKNIKSGFKRHIEKSIRSKNALVLIEEGKGYCLCHIKKNIPIFVIEKYGFISDLFVKKRYRGKGISSEFKNKAFEWFRQKKIKHAAIGVYSNNKKARKIYSKWGFIEHHIEMKRKI